MTDHTPRAKQSGWNSRRGFFIASLAARLVLGVVFVFSGVPKLIDPGHFYSQIMEFNVVGNSTAMWFACVVPVLELLIAACLLGGVLLGGTWINVILMMGGFTLLHLRVVALGQEINCGCFGPNGTQLISWWTVLRNAVLFVISVMGLLTYWHVTSLKLTCRVN